MTLQRATEREWPLDRDTRDRQHGTLGELAVPIAGTEREEPPRGIRTRRDPRRRRALGRVGGQAPDPRATSTGSPPDGAANGTASSPAADASSMSVRAATANAASPVAMASSSSPPASMPESSRVAVAVETAAVEGGAHEHAVVTSMVAQKIGGRPMRRREGVKAIEHEAGVGREHRSRARSIR